jgi:3-methyladenine DNA glycosylase Mpg
VHTLRRSGTTATRPALITGALNGLAATEQLGLWFLPGEATPAHIVKTARIGVGYAGPLWAAKEYRFLLDEAEP